MNGTFLNGLNISSAILAAAPVGVVHEGACMGLLSPIEARYVDGLVSDLLQKLHGPSACAVLSLQLRPWLIEEATAASAAFSAPCEISVSAGRVSEKAARGDTLVNAISSPLAGGNPVGKTVCVAKSARTKSTAKKAEALNRHEGNITRAADELGVPRKTLAEQISAAPDHSPIAGFRGGFFGRRAAAMEEKAVEALYSESGDINAAARIIGVNWQTLKRWIERAPHGSLLADFRNSELKYKGGILGRRVSDEQIVRALEECGGNRTGAARLLQVSEETVRYHIVKSPPDSPLTRYKSTRIERGGAAIAKCSSLNGKRTLTDDQIAEGLERYFGNRVLAGKYLKMKPATIVKRIRLTANLRLAIFRDIKPSGGARSRVSDRELSDALAMCNGDRKAAAQAVGMTYNALLKRILRARRFSPLRQFVTRS